MGKADTFVEKLDFSVGKASVVALNPSLLSSYEELFGSCRIVEEMQEMRTLLSLSPMIMHELVFVLFLSIRLPFVYI